MGRTQGRTRGRRARHLHFSSIPLTNHVDFKEENTFSSPVAHFKNNGGHSSSDAQCFWYAEADKDNIQPRRKFGAASHYFLGCFGQYT